MGERYGDIYIKVCVYIYIYISSVDVEIDLWSMCVRSVCFVYIDGTNTLTQGNIYQYKCVCLMHVSRSRGRPVMAQGPESRESGLRSREDCKFL